MSNDTLETSEQADLLSTLAQHRQFLRFTARDLDDEQATRRTTVSELTIAGLIKHVAAQEEHWANFIAVGASPADDFDAMTEQARARYTDEFRLLPGETLAGVLEHYTKVATRTDELVRSLPDLNAAHPLPQAPWFPPGAQWSDRQVLLHVLAETAQHAGHADIIREALDGAKTMG
jgi:uncharacterized damage-inducible protein DinB